MLRKWIQRYPVHICTYKHIRNFWMNAFAPKGRIPLAFLVYVDDIIVLVKASPFRLFCIWTGTNDQYQSHIQRFSCRTMCLCVFNPLENTKPTKQMWKKTMKWLTNQWSWGMGSIYWFSLVLLLHSCQVWTAAVFVTLDLDLNQIQRFDRNGPSQDYQISEQLCYGFMYSMKTFRIETW